MSNKEELAEKIIGHADKWKGYMEELRWYASEVEPVIMTDKSEGPPQYFVQLELANRVIMKLNTTFSDRDEAEDYAKGYLKRLGEGKIN